MTTTTLDFKRFCYFHIVHIPSHFFSQSHPSNLLFSYVCCLYLEGSTLVVPFSQNCYCLLSFSSHLW